MAFELTVIVPCYNEARRLPGFFELIAANAERDWEWLFVDDGSYDQTVHLIREFAATTKAAVHLHQLERNRGKGRAVREGLVRAQGLMVGFVDADLAASPLDFAPYLADPELRAGRCLLAGIRVKTQDGQVRRKFHRHLIGRVFQTYTSLVTGLTVYDTQCGFKLLNQARAREIAGLMHTSGFAFDVELMMLALALDMQIREVLIPWEEKGDSRIRLKHIFQMARDIWRIRRQLHEFRRQRR